jgi:uncharacterized membrane protein
MKSIEKVIKIDILMFLIGFSLNEQWCKFKCSNIIASITNCHIILFTTYTDMTNATLPFRHEGPF